MKTHSDEVEQEAAFRGFVSEVEPLLRQALVAMYGSARGREATADTLNWAWEHQYPLEGVSPGEAVDRLFRVALRRSRLLESTPAFDNPPRHLPWSGPELGLVLGLLPMRERTALLLVHGAGWSVAQVAELLHAPPGRVSRQAERALGRARRAVMQPVNDSEDTDLVRAAEEEADKVIRESFQRLFEEAREPITAAQAMLPSLYPLSDGAALLVEPSTTSVWRAVALAGLVLGLLVAGVVIGLGATRSTTITAYTTPGPQPSPGPISHSVVVVPNQPGPRGSHPSGLRALWEIDAGSHRVLESPAIPRAAAASAPVVTGPWIVDVLYGSVHSYPLAGQAVGFRTGSTKTVKLGLASTVIPGRNQGTVWLVLHHAGMNGRFSRFCTIRLESLTGQMLLRPTQLPCPWDVMGSVTGGIIVLARTGVTELWDPYSGLTNPLVGFAAPLVEAVNSTLVAEQWSSFCSVTCSIRVASPATDLVTKVHIVPPPGVSLTTSAAVSPNGKFLAFTALPINVATSMENSPFVGPPSSYRGSHSVRGQLVIVRVRTGVVAMSRPATFLQPSVVQWAPNGSYVFLTHSLRQVEAVPVWSDAAPTQIISFPARDTSPDDAGERFLIVQR
ncbi:MAG: RNA polymerase sigma factor [Acidimicrobiales bacterium]